MAITVQTSLTALDPQFFSNIQLPFFSLPSIQQSWWESHQQPELKVIEVKNAGKVVGVVPFCTFDEGKTLQFVGDEDVSDYLDWITDDPQKTALGLEKFLNENKEWQKIHLVSLPQNSTLIPALKHSAKKHTWTFIQKLQDVCPIINLPSTWDEYLQQIGKKQRHEVQRKWKRLESQVKIDFRVVKNISHDLTDLETFFKLHSLSSPEKAAFWTLEHRLYFEKLTLAANDAGWLRLYFLDIDGEPAAAMYCFDYGDSMLVYNSGFNAQKFLQLSAGQVLTAFTIKDAIKMGKKKYDFLRGGEEYKFHYGAKAEPVFNVTLTR